MTRYTQRWPKTLFSFSSASWGTRSLSALRFGSQVVALHTRKFFAVYTYLASPMILINYMIDLISNGFFRVLDPKAYEALSTAGSLAARSEIISNSKAVYVVYTFTAIDFCLVVLWSYIGWGAFREINHLSRMRSAVALVIGWTLAVPVLLLLALITVAVATP
jgi:hypothetical protein